MEANKKRYFFSKEKIEQSIETIHDGYAMNGFLHFSLLPWNIEFLHTQRGFLYNLNPNWKWIHGYVNKLFAWNSDCSHDDFIFLLCYQLACVIFYSVCFYRSIECFCFEIIERFVWVCWYNPTWSCRILFPFLNYFVRINCRGFFW